MCTSVGSAGRPPHGCRAGGPAGADTDAPGYSDEHCEIDEPLTDLTRLPSALGAMLAVRHQVAPEAQSVARAADALRPKVKHGKQDMAASVDTQGEICASVPKSLAHFAAKAKVIIGVLPSPQPGWSSRRRARQARLPPTYVARCPGSYAPGPAATAG